MNKQEEQSERSAVAEDTRRAEEVKKENGNPRSAVLPSDAGAMRVIESLLKSPGQFIARLQGGDFAMTGLNLIGVLSCGFIVYGVVTGSFSMGDQLWIAPLKIWLGVMITGLICFPSFYIFACLGQADLSLKQAFVLMLAGLTLVSILLIGFMPVALVFSTSTNSIAFMGFFHLIFWFISVAFGMRLIIRGLKLCNARWTFYVRFWVILFLITSLQMMTAIRPIIGKSEKILPETKMFFIENWIASMDGNENDEER